MLTGRSAEPRLREVTLALAAELLALAGSAEAPRARVERALDSGAAAERFARMVRALGGPSDLLERAGAVICRPRRSSARSTCRRPAWSRAIDARALGLAVIALGGGRQRATDRIDHAVGLSEVKGIGEPVGPDQPFAIVHARNEAAAAAASAALEGRGVASPRARAATAPQLIVGSSRAATSEPAKPLTSAPVGSHVNSVSKTAGGQRAVDCSRSARQLSRRVL